MAVRSKASDQMPEWSVAELPSSRGKCIDAATLAGNWGIGLDAAK